MNRKWSVIQAITILFATTQLFSPSCTAQDDIADIKSEQRKVGGDDRQTYFLIPAAREEAPEDGYALLVILPGGDGSADFHPFIKRIRKHALPDDFIVAQPVAVKWTDDQEVVWPTDKLTVEKQEFSTEQFVTALIKDVQVQHKIDAKRVYCLGWSSSGTSAYSLALQQEPLVKGSYVAMSVYKPTLLPIENAKGRSIYIEHSPDDRVCPFRMAEQGLKELKAKGANVTLITYEGGHGWRGDVYGRIRNAIQWLDNRKD